MNNSDKLDLTTPDLVNQNIEKIAALFPNCVTETAEGKVIDFDLLKQELNYEVVEGAKERYRLEWPGKKEAIVTANLPTTKTLRPVREDSVDFDTTENIYIEGDNLEVLKILQESYLGKIKMIYIDPPYNTGKDFVYKDNFTQDSADYKEETNQTDEYGNRLVANPETAGRYHSDWLSMMYPRLKLARNLLTDDGVIFISIDDNEVHNLRKIADEIFGESNFVAQIIWEKKYAPQNDAKYFSTSHDYILVYAKNKIKFNRNLLPLTEEQLKRYKNPDNDERGVWQSDNLTVATYSANYDYPITLPSGRVLNPPHGRCWRTSKEKFEKMVSENRVWFGEGGDNTPRIKRFLKETQQGRVPVTIWFYKEVGHNQAAAAEVKKLFGNKKYFDYPKPVSLISHMLKIASSKEDIILDFFSGSASTAQAIIQQNAEDGGNRKFIMAQLPEATDEKSEAHKAGYKNICEIGKERIRRAAAKIKEELAQSGVEGTNADIDYGFKVFKVASSNMQDVYYKPQDYNQGELDLFADNIKEDRTSEDLLTQILLDWGLPLTLKTQKETVLGKEVFVVDTNYLLACFDKDLDEAFAKAIAKYQPLRFVCKDSSFKDDTAKENVKQLLKQLSPNTEMKVI
ncbi:site-specific DNA-methyltransferase [Corallibacter sp.]|uniref:site-specific DNA-methyltransferase n=1 Tax=Corallibacter sp. TaxID=2038084 RepID=UPI003AB343E4